MVRFRESIVSQNSRQMNVNSKRKNNSKSGYKDEPMKLGDPIILKKKV